MIGKLKFKWAGNILILLSSLLIVFHIINLLGLIPDNIVWTGRVTSERTKLIMGAVSIILNLIILLSAAIRLNYIGNEKQQELVRKILPFLFYWLVGNTIANLFSKSMTEVLVFTPILVILTISCYRIKIEKTTKEL